MQYSVYECSYITVCVYCNTHCYLCMYSTSRFPHAEDFPQVFVRVGDIRHCQLLHFHPGRLSPGCVFAAASLLPHISQGDQKT